jgi:hypothetical protein
LWFVECTVGGLIQSMLEKPLGHEHAVLVDPVRHGVPIIPAGKI